MKKIAYLISSIEEYGKFIAYCIDKDISVWRTYWNKEYIYHISWKEKRCYYSSKQYYNFNGYDIRIPKFEINEFDKYVLIEE